jgi:hypothetical protein
MDASFEELVGFTPKTGAEIVALAQFQAASGQAVKLSNGRVVAMSPDTFAAKEIADRVEGKAPMAEEDREAFGKPEPFERDEFLREFMQRVGMAAAAGAALGASAAVAKRKGK